MSDQKWASWCPCCRDYDFTEKHLKHCALHDAQALNAELVEALRIAEAGLADIGDADREPGDDLAWCEERAAQALPPVRAALKKLEASNE